jgi:hypothetical protein
LGGPQGWYAQSEEEKKSLTLPGIKSLLVKDQNPITHLEATNPQS